MERASLMGEHVRSEESIRRAMMRKMISLHDNKAEQELLKLLDAYEITINDKVKNISQKEISQFTEKYENIQDVNKNIHKKIKIASRQKYEDRFTFYVIPEFLLGIPTYDVATCTSYVMQKLRENGFMVKYTHPNLLFISWKRWIPDYRRVEYKKRTGIKINGFGKVAFNIVLSNAVLRSIPSAVILSTFVPNCCISYIPYLVRTLLFC